MLGGENAVEFCRTLAVEYLFGGKHCEPVLFPRVIVRG
jgi:hypothetical protein